MQRLATLTALHLTGTKNKKVGELFSHTCPMCGSSALTDAAFTYCADVSCVLSMASAVDTVAACAGGYDTAAELVASHLRLPETQDFSEDKRNRTVFSWWKSCTTTSNINPAQSVAAQRVRSSGKEITRNDFGVAILSPKDADDLIAIAAATGCSFPVEFKPEYRCFIAYAVQTRPNVIDRILLLPPSGKPITFTWNAFSMGVVGLGGVRPNRDYYIHADINLALRRNRKDTLIGEQRNHIAVMEFQGVALPDPEIWLPGASRNFITVIDNSHDLGPFSTLNSCCQHSLRSITSGVFNMDAAVDIVPISWSKMRKAVLKHALRDSLHSLTAEADAVLTISRPSREEGAAMIQDLRASGRLNVAHHVKRKLLSNVIYNGDKYQIIENVGDYVHRKNGVLTSITNFSLVFRHNLYMPDTGSVCHAVTLVFGKTSVNITISSASVDSARALQEAVRTQMLGRIGVAGDSLPTVVDSGLLRKHVLPYFRTCIGALEPREGVAKLGWSHDRSRFTAPGLCVGIDGAVYGETHYDPGVRIFESMNSNHEWVGQHIDEIREDGRNIVSLIVAVILRGYLHIPSPPVVLQNNAATRRVILAAFSALGQRNVIELSASAREHKGVPGVTGYPIVVSGYTSKQASTATFPYFVLTDSGYTVSEEFTEDELHRMASTIQHAVLRTVEWCIATGAEDFSERRAVTSIRALLEEGAWILRNVCNAQPWEIAVSREAHVERMLEIITSRNEQSLITLQKDLRVKFSLRHDLYDVGAVASELQEMDVNFSVGDNHLTVDASYMLPAMKCFYGRTPRMVVEV